MVVDLILTDLAGHVDDSVERGASAFALHVAFSVEHLAFSAHEAQVCATLLDWQGAILRLPDCDTRVYKANSHLFQVSVLRIVIDYIHVCPFQA